MKTKLFVAAILCAYSITFGQNTAFTYQGRLSENSALFNGTAELQFTLWNSPTNGTLVAANTPASAIVAISNGLFTASLDFGAAAFDGSERWLQIDVRTTLGPFSTLVPRQRLAPAPYSIHAADAATAATLTGPLADSLLSSNIARLQSSPSFTGTVSAASFAGSGSGLTGITHLDAASNGPIGALTVDALGHVDVGAATNDSSAALQVSGGGTYSMPAFRGAVTNGSGGLSNMLNPVNVFVSGNRAYVTAYSPGALVIFDISDRLRPVFLGQAVDDSGAPTSAFHRLNGASGLFVTNDIAFVTSENESAVTIINVSNPANPLKLAEIVNGVGGVTNLSVPTGVLVWSNKLFVISFSSSALSVFDISNPASPVLVKEILDDSVRPGSLFTKLYTPYQMTRAGTRLFIAARVDSAVTILDIANPANPQLLGEMVDASVNPASPFSRLRNVNWIDVVGNIAYIAAGAFDGSTGSLTLADVSNPASPIKIAELNDDTVQPGSPYTKLRGAWSVKVMNGIAFVNSAAEDAVTAIDVSSPATPRLLKEFINGAEGINTLRFPEGLAGADNVLYVAADSSAALNMFSLQATLGLQVQNAVGIGTSAPRTALDVAGTITATRLAVEQGMRVVGNWDGANGALEVAGDKPTIRFTGGAAAANVSWAIQVGNFGNLDFLQAYAGSSFQNPMSLSTVGLGIGTTSPQQKLHIVSGEARARFQSLGSSGSAASEYMTDVRTWHNGAGGSTAGGGLNNKYYIYDATASQTRMVVDTGGNVGIGTVSPGATLDVRTTAGSGNAIRFGYYSGGAGNLIAGPSRVGIATDDLVERISIPQNTGNVGLGTLSPSQKLHVIGNILASGTITPNSDVNAKTNFAPVNVADVLERVTRLPIQQWRFKAEPDGVKHVGPMAQDFRAAFGLGEIPTAIATVDADGVALAAIQGLNHKLEAKDAEIQELKHELAALKAAVRSLAARARP